MTPTEPRLRAALDAAMSQIQTTAAAVADRVSDMLSTMAESSTRIIERDLMLLARVDLLRNIASFHAAFRDVLRDKVNGDLAPHGTARRSLAATDWQSLSLVDDQEVEERMVSDRIAQLITHECESELRELNSYVSAMLRAARTDDSRNPLRAEIVGAALYSAIEAVTDQLDLRKLLTRDMGWAMARAMPVCYAEIVRDLKARGVQPIGMTVRSVEGPGNQLGGAQSGYSTAGRDWHSTGNHAAEFAPPAGSAGVSDFASGVGGVGQRHSGPSGPGQSGPGYSGPGHLRADSMSGRGGFESRHAPSAADQADAQLMNLLRRLTALASRPGELDERFRNSANGGMNTDLDGSAGLVGGTGGEGGLGGAGYGTGYGTGYGVAPGGGLPGLMAKNLIRAHREELRQASGGRLDHMVIDVVGSLFDQILSDSRVPPQMARQIARLQLPVLRVALNDTSFFSSRRHPVRRFVNRMASLACAFEEFEEGPGKEFITRVRELVQEIVEGDFDQIEIYSAKLSELESFIARQTQASVEPTGAVETLETKESELRIQQRYMLQLQSALAPMSLPKYLRDFLSQVWSQAMVLAVTRDGAESDRAQRYRRVGRDLVMSVQPKGSPALRKKFLMQLPPMMKDLYEGMKLLGWSEVAQKEFFSKLLPAHAESLKGAPLSELDHNLMVKELDGVFSMPVPGSETLSPADIVPEVQPGVEIERRFTPQEAQAVGLVEEAAVDWSGQVDIDLGLDSGHGAADVAAIGVDINLDLASTEPNEPSKGPKLMDHIQLGFAYQMNLKDQWQKVRLTYMSPGRSFFVFSRGKKYQETISMTSRMLTRMCETGRLRAFENAYLMERATQRARKQLADMKAPTLKPAPKVAPKP
ncbi:MAG: hypothetical protein AD742_04395 [Methylibium sp. NZG]|nr:MAG: hypothetical protein AD742_04395 [Methylibium sp. NZG]